VIDGDQSHETCADAIHSDDLEATIQGGLVSLDQIIEARWRSRPECNPDAAERQRFLRFLPELERLYGAGQGGAIQDTYFSRHILARAVLTADHEIHLRYPPESVAAVSPEFEEAIWRCTSLSRQGSRTCMRSTARRHCGCCTPWLSTCWGARRPARRHRFVAGG
jgi:hypothetical protein